MNINSVIPAGSYIATAVPDMEHFMSDTRDLKLTINEDSCDLMIIRPNKSNKHIQLIQTILKTPYSSQLDKNRYSGEGWDIVFVLRNNNLKPEYMLQLYVGGCLFGLYYVFDDKKICDQSDI